MRRNHSALSKVFAVTWRPLMALVWLLGALLVLIFYACTLPLWLPGALTYRRGGAKE